MDEPPPGSEPPDPPASLLERLSRDEKILVGCSLFTVLLCFLPWFSVTVEAADGMEMFFQGGASANAFDFARGVIAFLFALATVAFVLAVKLGHLKVAKENALLLPMLGSAGAALFLLFFVASSASSVSSPMLSASAGKTFWPVLALIAMVVATIFAFRSWTQARQTGGTAS